MTNQTLDRAPTLHSDRLTLRHHCYADFAPLADLFETERSRHMGGPIPRSVLWRWLAAEVGSWSLLGFGSWAIDLRDSGKTIGQIGINKPDDFPEIELGWILYESHEGFGFAQEAAIAARNWAYGPRALPSLVSYIDPANTRSIALAERLGARPDPDAARPDPTDLVYRHPAPARAA